MGRDESKTDAATPAFGVVEASLLAEALDLPLSRVIARSREPLGAGSVAGFDVVPDDPVADGADTTEVGLRYFVDTSRQPVATETGLALGDPAAPEARVWLHPADPHLPALAPVAFGHAADTLLARLGIVADGAPELVAYRPGRRAVLRVATPDAPVWIKVVRPGRVERIVHGYGLLAQNKVPMPTLRGWAPDGLIVIDDADGTPATDVAWDADRLLDEVDELRSRFARVPLESRVNGVARRLPWYAARITGALAEAGGRRDRVGRLVARLEGELARASEDRHRGMTVVHGDLHFGQLFLTPGGAISAVIDVDTAGIGEQGEDPAAFLSHAIASALLTREGPVRDRVWGLADRAYERWVTDAAPDVATAASIAPLASVHLLGHALGALDRGETAMADVLLAAAEALDAGAAPSSARPKDRLTRDFEAP